mmetsp:Transcript_4939/g.7490  ORF Transcript_4939/g.7490 Transcript_4939/m.7490 type:complete len:265 (-) Transcript_4939:46-840(-)
MNRLFSLDGILAVALVSCSAMLSCCPCEGFIPLSKMPSIMMKEKRHPSSFLFAKVDNNQVVEEAMLPSITRTFQKATTTLATSALLLVSSTIIAPKLPAIADTTTQQTSAALVFKNDYNDPSHPLCGRHIDVGSDGTTFKYSGTALNRDLPSSAPFAFGVDGGCSRKEIAEYGIRTIAGDGVISDNGKTMELEGMKGTWVEESTDGDESAGILWNDGTKWSVKEQSVSTQAGSAFFYAYIGFSTLAGFKGVADKINEKRDAAKN